jgi:hypothetical protein
MSTHQQLSAGALSQLKRPTRRGHVGCGEKFVRGFGRPARVGKRLAQTNFEIEKIRRIRFEFHRAPEVKRRAVKCQRARCFACGGFGMNGSAIVFAGAAIVFIQALRIIKAARFGRLRQPSMNMLSFGLGQQRSDRFANAIVVNLDAVLCAATTNELRRPQQRQ